MISNLPVIDLHCDLLAYLRYNRAQHNSMQADSRCSLPLLREGGVKTQVLAVFTETQPHSTLNAQEQIACYQEMLKKHSDWCASFSELDEKSSRIHFSLALENASGLLEEEESFEKLFQRFETQDWLYISLTWNEENRFGGGNATSVGLKQDGELFLEYMDGKQVAIDLSHTSDALAHGILNHIHKKGLKLIPIASHSNLRRVKDHPRNLPDELAKEIMRLGGVIGLNFVRHFVGDHPKDFIQHIEQALTIGGENHLCLGADFFGGIPMPKIEHLRPFFQESYSNSACYPHFLSFLETAFSMQQIQKIAHQNAEAFFKRLRPL